MVSVRAPRDLHTTSRLTMKPSAVLLLGLVLSISSQGATAQATGPGFMDGLLGGGGGGGGSPASLLSSLMQQTGLQGQMDAGSLMEGIEGIREKFCTQPTVTRGHKVPSVLLGPQLNITLSSGNCSLASNGLGKNVTCFGPSVSFSKAPSSFEAKHWSPDLFVDGSCVFAKALGPQQGPEVQVLYSGDDDLVFSSLDHFLQALRGGGLDGVLGAPAPSASAAGGASASARLAAGQGADAWNGQQGSLEALLQAAGWDVVMSGQPKVAGPAGADAVQA